MTLNLDGLSLQDRERAQTFRRMMLEGALPLADVEEHTRWFVSQLHASRNVAHDPPLVVIESPLKSDTREGIELHKRYARQCVRDSLARGEAPYASHLFFDHPEILDDMNAQQREIGMLAGFAWGQHASIVAAYTDLGISEGMVRGIERARQRKQSIEYRSISVGAKFDESMIVY